MANLVTLLATSNKEKRVSAGKHDTTGIRQNQVQVQHDYLPARVRVAGYTRHD